MALIKCKYCGNVISDKAIKCVHCGKDLSIGIEDNNPNKKRLIKIMTTIIVICILIAVGITVPIIVTKKKNQEIERIRIEEANNRIQKVIDDIDSIGEITLSSKDILDVINKEYLELPEEDRSKVSNYNKLKSAYDGFNLGIVIGYFLLILCESITVWLFIKYGLDKVTCVLPLISIVMICVFRGGMLGAVDSGLSTYAYSSVKGSVFSIWTFMYLMFFVAMVVCLVLYLDSDFLYDTIKNPKELFTKKTILGTYTNLYLDEKPIDSFQKNAEQLSNSIGICEECGNPIYLGQTICNNCGCPITQIKQVTSTIENTENIDKNEISSNIQEDFDNLQDKESNNICPDCKSIVYPGQSICTNCGCPIKSDHQEEQNYDFQRNATSFTNSIKGDIYPNTIKEATNNGYSVNNKKPQWLFLIFVIVAVVIFFVSRSGVLHYSTGKVLFQAERIRLVNDRDECLKGAEEYKGTKWEAEYKSVADTDQSNIKICDEQIKNHETKENICLWIERISIILGLCFFVAFAYSLIKE